MALLGSGLLMGPAVPGVAVDEPGAFQAVGSPPAIHLALQSNLNAIRDWLKEKDFVSAAETTHGFASLANLYSYYSADTEWRKRCAALAGAIARVADAAKRKSAADCEKAIAECEQLLGELSKARPEAPAASKNFKPHGGVKTWMLLMEGAYVDAKSAKTGKELDLLAQGIAAEANAVSHLRTDATWRKEALTVRDTALGVSEQARGNDFAAAKKALKGIYQRCEACHNRSRKK